ncbi:MAG: hypothetical protein ACM3U2_21170 [Deltaproteobacteria bacterium]
MFLRVVSQNFGVRRLVVVGAVLVAAGTAAAQFQYHAVPGRGQKVKEVGDDFEDKEWGYFENGPKSSSNLDHDERLPSGISKNQRVYESTYRGQPDVVKRVETPPGGLRGSNYSLSLRSKVTGVPGRPSYQMQQDDLLVNVSSLMGGPISVSKSPSVVVRVFLPPFEQWEKRTGSTFGFRAELEGGSMRLASHKGFFGKGSKMKRKYEAYWPGFFIQFNSRSDGQNKEDSAQLVIRAGAQGEDIVGPKITETGWWTLGMTFTPDGSTHFYASPGVDPLTERDHITTTKPYGHTAEKLNTFFFNVVNQDDGRTWSTEWIVDDPALYLYTR